MPSRFGRPTTRLGSRPGPRPTRRRSRLRPLRAPVIFRLRASLLSPESRTDGLDWPCGWCCVTPISGPPVLETYRPVYAGSGVRSRSDRATRPMINAPVLLQIGEGIRRGPARNRRYRPDPFSCADDHGAVGSANAGEIVRIGPAVVNAGNRLSNRRPRSRPRGSLSRRSLPGIIGPPPLLDETSLPWRCPAIPPIGRTALRPLKFCPSFAVAVAILGPAVMSRCMGRRS